MHKRALGGLGEKAAIEYLKNKNFKILATNWRCPLGEIDIIAKENSDLVFIEVKTRREATKDAFSPWESVNYYKQERLRKLAMTYTFQNRRQISQERIAKLRLDVIAVCYKVTGSSYDFKINHLRQALMDH